MPQNRRQTEGPGNYRDRPGRQYSVLSMHGEDSAESSPTLTEQISEQDTRLLLLTCTTETEAISKSLRMHRIGIGIFATLVVIAIIVIIHKLYQ